MNFKFMFMVDFLIIIFGAFTGAYIENINPGYFSIGLGNIVATLYVAMVWAFNVYLGYAWYGNKNKKNIVEVTKQ